MGFSFGSKALCSCEMGAALAATRASPPQGGAFRTARAGANLSKSNFQFP